LYYPPIPTYHGAFVGGTIATNAAGAATFKYGSTRPWVDSINVILADGSHVEIQRGVVTGRLGDPPDAPSDSVAQRELPPWHGRGCAGSAR
jgi:FAD/FMN-containing dehydrogenase